MLKFSFSEKATEICATFLVVLTFTLLQVIYPKYSKHWSYTVAHTIDCVCSKMLNHGLNHELFLSLFKFFWMKIHSKLNRFRINKILDCYIVSDLRFLLEIQGILPETNPYLSAQMAVLSSFFQMFIKTIHYKRSAWILALDQSNTFVICT